MDFCHHNINCVSGLVRLVATKIDRPLSSSGYNTGISAVPEHYSNHLDGFQWSRLVARS